MAGLIAKYHCNYCQEDITGLRVKCAECPDFDLCLQCFSCRAEIGEHEFNHRYQLIDCGNIPIFQPPHDWKAKEELALLEIVEHFGFGNWEDVSESIGKTTEEVCEHYNNLFVYGNIGRATWLSRNGHQVQDHTCPENGPLSPSLTTPLPPLELSSQEQQELGYMPDRDDFEREYDNDAEAVTCNLSIHNDDEDIDIALKLAHIDIYSRKLKERFRRKKIAREYGLVSQFFNSSSSNKQKSMNTKKSAREDKDMQEKMRVFCQFQAATEQEQFYQNLQKEKEVKSRIKELMRYRRNGLTKLEECAAFETARYKRERKKENKKKSGSSGSVHRRSTLVSKKPEEKDGESGQDKQEKTVLKEEIKEVDISTLPNYQLLSAREKLLCSTVGLKPAQYISFKAVLLKDHLKKKQGNTVKPKYPAGLDKTMRKKIINYLVHSGWITAR
ncbi:transcriptional adapter 2-beta-like isoform X1 [Tachypleus tridentatus]|uniref:transcriptional adapter 2-beta-like isoform X1 n=1 Tax=Tachypleus tridentatus TaxID=6853 RepID=UPI003FD1DA6C